MVLEEVVKKSTPTDTFSDALWLQIDDTVGYLGIPVEYDAEIFSRNVLCDLQGIPHIPVMENVGEMDCHVWFKVEYLQSFYSFYGVCSTPWKHMFRMDIVTSKSTNITKIDEQIESCAATLQIIQEKLLENDLFIYSWDLHNDNIRVRQDGTLMFTDPVCS